MGTYAALLPKGMSANIEKLERENGACIVYTHFGEGFVDKRGEVPQEFAQRLRFLAGRLGTFQLISSKVGPYLAYGKDSKEVPL